MEQYLVRLYPQTWPSRYEEEFLAFLEQRSISFLDGVDLFFGALDAHLYPELGTTGMSLYERMRRNEQSAYLYAETIESECLSNLCVSSFVLPFLADQ
jgi:hypothetical protein